VRCGAPDKANVSLGTPQELTDTQGEIVWSAQYRAWGAAKEVISTAAQAAGIRNPIRFQGQYWDRETGLHYNRHRYYDPEIGRFIAKDPIGFAGGLNVYQYADNPVEWVDPLGLHNILANTDLVCRGGACSAESFRAGSGVVLNGDGTLNGISTQSAPSATLETLSRPFQHNQVGVATVGDIEKAGGSITLDGRLNSANGEMVMNHATVDGLSPEDAQRLFQPTQQNPIPKGRRGVGGC